MGTLAVSGRSVAERRGNTECLPLALLGASPDEGAAGVTAVTNMPDIYVGDYAAARRRGN
jgi:hypothetical protein